MQLTEQEKTVMKDLQTQEQLCMEKYTFYENSAKDPELKNLFAKIGADEKEHYDSLGKALKGDVPTVSNATDKASSYQPSVTYGADNNSADKTHDKFLCTDCIATEKLVSSTYNSDLFKFAANNIRKLLNHIQTEEQEHAEMIYKYKSANGMA